MIKAKNKETRTTSSTSVVDFKQVYAGWETDTWNWNFDNVLNDKYFLHTELE